MTLPASSASLFPLGGEKQPILNLGLPWNFKIPYTNQQIEELIFVLWT